MYMPHLFFCGWAANLSLLSIHLSSVLMWWGDHSSAWCRSTLLTDHLYSSERNSGRTTKQLLTIAHSNPNNVVGSSNSLYNTLFYKTKTGVRDATLAKATQWGSAVSKVEGLDLSENPIYTGKSYLCILERLIHTSWKQQKGRDTVL